MVEIHRVGTWLQARYMVTLVEGNTWWDASFHLTSWRATRKAREFERRIAGRKGKADAASGVA